MIKSRHPTDIHCFSFYGHLSRTCAYPRADDLTIKSSLNSNIILQAHTNAVLTVVSHPQENNSVEYFPLFPIRASKSENVVFFDFFSPLSW